MAGFSVPAYYERAIGKDRNSVLVMDFALLGLVWSLSNLICRIRTHHFDAELSQILRQIGKYNHKGNHLA